MIRTVVFSDEIIIWWEKTKTVSPKTVYRIFCNGKQVGQTNKTHFTLTGLRENTHYALSIKKGNTLLGELSLVTKKGKNKLDITKPPYNAVGDGKTVNTAALQKALDDCTENDCVYMPAGVFLTGALNVHSDTEIYLCENAVLQGTVYPSDYLPKVRSRFEGIERECYRSLLNIGTLDHTAGYTTQNIVIRGKGSIVGGGKPLCDGIIEAERERLKEYLEKNAAYVATCESERTIPGRARGRLVAIRNCKNAVVSGVTLAYGPAWNVHFVYSENITVCNCKISSQGVWNGDGIDPDSSENVAIFGVEFDTHDDAIAIKSGKNPEGNIINRRTKNVRIFDCNGMRGIAIGSEMSGGIEDVAVWDCKMNAFRVKTTAKRGGYVKNVRVYDCSFRADIRIWTKYTCNDDNEGAGALAVLENFRFENVEIFGVNNERQGDFPVEPIQLVGFDEPSHYLRNVVFNGVTLHSPEQSLKVENVEKVSIKDIKFGG